MQRLSRAVRAGVVRSLSLASAVQSERRPSTPLGKTGRCSAWHPAPAWVLGLFAVACTAACRGEAPEAAAVPAQAVVATVNGRAVSRAQLDLRLQSSGGHERPGESKEARRRALEGLIAQELEAQQAQTQGLADAPAFRALEAQLEAQLAELRRRELARLYQEQLAASVQVSEAELSAFAQAQAPRVGQEVRVSQLLVKSRAQADALAAELAAGTPYDEVARRSFPQLPVDSQPWRLGFLNWQQVPEAWWPHLEGLAPGQVSAVITGEKDRFWILRLDERRASQASPESSRAGLAAMLRARKLEAARIAATQELRARAVVQLVEAP